MVTFEGMRQWARENGIGIAKLNAGLQDSRHSAAMNAAPLAQTMQERRGSTASIMPSASSDMAQSMQGAERLDA